MIDFELNPFQKEVQEATHQVAEELLRPIGRHYDEQEHEYIKETPEVVERTAPISDKIALKPGQFPPKGFGIGMVIMSEERAWGDVGVALGATRRGLGNAAINAVATDEQKTRFGEKYTAMAITEPGCGSDTANIRTTAKLDEATNEWILNGEKIFVTAGDHCEAVVVWATLDRSLGRAAIKSFVVEKGAPGMTVTKVEDKLGIRASDTASIVFEDCRIPYDNILGTAEVKERKAGLGGAMKTFDATRPGVAALAIGVARAALEFTRQKLEEEGYTFPYGRGLHELSYVQRTVMDMEANIEVARLLTWKSAAMLETGAREQPRGGHGQSQGRPGRDPDHPEVRRAAGPPGLLPRLAGGKVDAGLQDHGHLRGHGPDSDADHRPQRPGIRTGHAQVTPGRAPRPQRGPRRCVGRPRFLSWRPDGPPAVVRLLPGPAHPQCAVQPDELPVEVGVFNDVAGQAGELGRLAQPRGKRDLLAQPLAAVFGQPGQHGACS